MEVEEDRTYTARIPPVSFRARGPPMCARCGSAQLGSLETTDLSVPSETRPKVLSVSCYASPTGNQTEGNIP